MLLSCPKIDYLRLCINSIKSDELRATSAQFITVAGGGMGKAGASYREKWRTENYTHIERVAVYENPISKTLLTLANAMWHFKSKKLDFLNGNYNAVTDSRKSTSSFTFRRLNSVVPVKPMATLCEDEFLVNYHQSPSSTTTIVIKKGSLSTPMKNSQSYNVEDYCSTSSSASSTNSTPFNNNCIPSPPSYHVTSSRKNFNDNNSPAVAAPANMARHYYQQPQQQQSSSPGVYNPNFCGISRATDNLRKLLPNSKSDYLLRQQRLVPYSTSWCSQQPLLELEAVRDFYEEQRRYQQQQPFRKCSSPTRRRMPHSESAGSCVYGRANVQLTHQHQHQIWSAENEQETSFLFNGGAGNFSSNNGIMTRSFSNNSASHSLASSSGFESLKNNSAQHQQQQQQQPSFQPQKTNNNLAVGASTFSFSSNSNNSHVGPNFHNSPSFSSSVQSSQCSSSLEKLDELTGSFSSQSSSNQIPNSSSSSAKKINIAEMVKCGVSEEEILNIWFHNLRFEEYIPLFYNAGYDIMTISKMTPEDLTAVGVTKPSHRKRLTAEIKRLGLVDNWPVQSPLTLKSWLVDLGLQQYVPWFAAQGFVSVEQILNLTWEDFEDVGVKKLGHLKKLVCAVKKLKDHRRRNFGHHDHRASVCSIDETSSSVSSTASPTFRNARNDDGDADYSNRMGEILRISVSGGQNSARSTTSGQYSINSNCDTVSLKSMSSSRSTLLTFNALPINDSQDNVRETDILCGDYEDRGHMINNHFGSQFQKSQNLDFQNDLYATSRLSFRNQSPSKNNFCESLSMLSGRCPDFSDGQHQSLDAWPPIGSSGGGNFWTSPQNPVIKHQPDRPKLIVKPCSVIYGNSATVANGLTNPIEKWPYQYGGDEKQTLLNGETNRLDFCGKEGNSNPLSNRSLHSLPTPVKEDHQAAKFFTAKKTALDYTGRPPGVPVPYTTTSYGQNAGSLTNSRTAFTLRPGPQQVPNYGFDDAGVGIIVPANEVQKVSLDRKGSKKKSSIITISSHSSKISPTDTPLIISNSNFEKLSSRKDFDNTINNNNSISSSSSSTTIKKVTFASNDLSSPVNFTPSMANFSSKEYVEHTNQFKNGAKDFFVNQKSPKISHNATIVDKGVEKNRLDVDIFNAESIA